MGITKVILTEIDIRNCVIKLKDKIILDGFKPDYIIGISRGGLIPAQYLAYGLNIKNIKTISLQLRDGKVETEKIGQLIIDIFSDGSSKNVLIVDDLVDSGDTLELIKKEFKTNLLDIRTAVLYQNQEAGLSAKYFGEIKPDGWLDFPWDNL